MDLSKRLPTVKDFRAYGKFADVQDLDKYKDIPLVILCHIYPDYLFISDQISLEVLDIIRNHCLVMKQFAEYEDKYEKLKDQKELQLRRLEDKIHSYYLNREKFCNCNL